MNAVLNTVVRAMDADANRSRLADWWDAWRMERMARKAVWHTREAQKIERNIRRGRLRPSPTDIVSSIVFWGLIYPVLMVLVLAFVRWIWTFI